MVDLIIFLFVSIFFVYFSWSYLTRFRTYQFYRFFVWEFILILFIQNWRTWFHDPFAWNQWISWILLLISLFLLLAGIYYLHNFGKPIDSVEMTSILVDNGIYKYIRHPLYSSMLFLTWGIFFKSPSIIEFFLSLLIFLFINATAREDEKASLTKFGSDYIAYMSNTKRFIPYLY
jgi:protein-S-isoprenylcysteine O-methyltransferase Ste14